MKYQEALKEQKKLDQKIVNCPMCEKQVAWWELREFGVCFECYAEATQSEEEKLLNK